MSATQAIAMKIFGVPLSVHTRKVILAARLKAIPHQVVPVVPVIPNNPPANWRSISPTGLIPAIDDAGYILADSTAILLYLERKASEPALLPADLKDYGRALFLDSWAGSELFQKVVRPIFHNQVVAPHIRKIAGDQAQIDEALNKAGPEAFAYLEGLRPGHFLVGDNLTIADLAVVSNLLVFHYLGHRIDAQRFPMLQAYFRRHAESPALASVLDEEKPFAESMGLDRSFIRQAPLPER